MKELIRFILLIAFAATALAGVAAEGSARTNAIVVTPEFLSQLAAEMATNNPALRALEARTNAAAANIGTVRTWDDPMARVGGMAGSEMMRAEDGDLIYGVEQRLPLFGKPRLARRVAQAEFSTQTAELDYQFQILRSEFAKNAFQTALAEEVVAIGQQDLAWLETLAQTADVRYRVGEATLVDVLQAENERARRETQLQTDRNRIEIEYVRLNRALNRDLHSAWPVLKLPPLAGQIFFNQRLVDFALNFEPRIKTMREQIRQAEATVDLTRRQRLPDVSVGVEGRNYSGTGDFRQGMVMLSMNLPWGNAGRYRNEIRREEARLRATELELADYQLAVREEVHQLTVRIDSARREALVYRDQIIPRSESALDSARAGWEANRNTFRDVLDARRMLLEARLMYARAVAEQYQMMSELVLCCGLGDLEALEMIGAEPDERKNEN